MAAATVSHAKDVEQRAGHRTLPTALEGSAQLVAPELPARLEKVDDDLQERWEAVWTSPVAQILDPVSDLEPMTRLFVLYARGRQLDEAFERQLAWLEAGDVDMPFDPQFARVLLGFAAEIRQLEQTLGITPRGRLVIGAAVVAAGRSAGAGEAVRDDADD